MRTIAIKVLLDSHKLLGEELRDLKRARTQVNADEQPYYDKLITFVQGMQTEVREAIAIVEAAP